MSTLSCLFLIIVLFCSYVFTGAIRSYALHKGIIDTPNARSSHQVATPRGGGLAIAIVFLVSTSLLALFRLAPTRVALALVCGGVIIASVGWLDDIKGLTPSHRAIAHAIAAVVSVACVGGLNYLRLGYLVLPLGWVGNVLAVLGIVWMINLYNFMDGLDGLAASEAVIVGLFAGLLLSLSGFHELAILSFALACSTAGFLVWNWPPAKIFMGDVSSGLLGFAFGTLALFSERSGAVPLLVWLLLLAVFVVDATATLIRRLLCGERWFDAHRTHAYQLVASNGVGHRRVTMAICGINLVLGFVSWLITAEPKYFAFAMIICFGSLIYVWKSITKQYLAPGA